MTNSRNAIGTNAAFNGRTSVKAFNDVLGALKRGVLSGWECKASKGLTVTLGGNASVRDVAIAENNSGDRVTINNISGSPVSVELTAAPGVNSRIDAIVAYVDGSTRGAGNVDNPDICGIIAVAGTPDSSPMAPDDSAIRSAITSDGADGVTAYYVVLATIKMTTGLTTVTNTEITQGEPARLATMAYGIKILGNVNANSEGGATISIPRQADTHYHVFLSLHASEEWYHLRPPVCAGKNLDSFFCKTFNNSSATARNVAIEWLILP